MTGLVWQAWAICPCGHTVLGTLVDDIVNPDSIAHLGRMTDLCPSPFGLAWDGDWIPDVPRQKRRAATVEPVG